MKNEFHFWLQVPSLYGNKRKNGELSRHRIGYFKAYKQDDKVYLTGSFIANTQDKFNESKAIELADKRRPINLEELDIDFANGLDIRDVIKKMKLHTKGQDISFLMSPLFRVKNITDIKGIKMVNTIKESEANCLEHNNYELNRIVRLAKNVTNN